MYKSLQPHGLYSLWNSPGQNTGVGCRALLQGLLPTLGSNLDFLHCRWLSSELPGKPKNTGVAYPFSKGTFWPRNRTGVSCTTGGFFTSWAIRKAPESNLANGNRQYFFWTPKEFLSVNLLGDNRIKVYYFHVHLNQGGYFHYASSSQGLESLRSN